MLTLHAKALVFEHVFEENNVGRVPAYLWLRVVVIASGARKQWSGNDFELKARLACRSMEVIFESA